MSPIITKARIEKLCKQISESKRLSSDYGAFQGLLIKLPVLDCLLGCILFEQMQYEPKLVNIVPTILPLYYPLPGFKLTYSRELIRSDTQDKVGGWTLDEDEAVIAEINAQAEPFFERCRNAAGFAREASRISSISNYSLHEEIAASYAQAGNLARARAMLELLSVINWIARDQEALDRISPLKTALRADVHAVRKVLRKTVEDNIKVLELDGIEKFLNLDQLHGKDDGEPNK